MFGLTNNRVSKTGRIAKCRKRKSLQIESLERRDLMAGWQLDSSPDMTASGWGSLLPPEGISVSGSTVYISGNENMDDAVVTDEGDQLRVVLQQTRMMKSRITGMDLPIITSVEQLFDTANVGKIVFYGHGSNDTFRNDSSVPSVAYGGSGSDKLYGGAAADKLYGGDEYDLLDGGSDGDTIHGGGGNDRIDGGSGDDVLYGDSGDDWLYGGAGSDTLRGGSDDDILVTIGGGQMDSLDGDSGFDSFWMDKESTELLKGVSYAEWAAGHVHRVGSFYTNTVGGEPQTPSRELNGEDLIDPTPISDNLMKADYSNNPLFPDTGPNVEDVIQGGGELGVGDCYFVAYLASLAYRMPDRILQTVVDLGDGTYAVHFHDQTGQDAFVRVDGELYTSNGNLVYARLGTQSSIWAPIIEKAWAYYRTGAGSYASIEAGGSKGNAIAYFDAIKVDSTLFRNDTITTRYGEMDRFADATAYVQAIKKEFDAGKAISIGGPPKLSANLDLTKAANYRRGKHIFTVIEVSDDLSTVTVRNPYKSGADKYLVIPAETLYYGSSGFRSFS